MNCWSYVVSYQELYCDYNLVLVCTDTDREVKGYRADCLVRK